MNTASTLAVGKRPRWRRYVRTGVALVLVPALLYVAGYFIVMDRRLPTTGFLYGRDYFDSSYRWAVKQPIGKGGPDSPWPAATGWNDVYRPLDRVYFALFPRADAEIEQLKQLGNTK